MNIPKILIAAGLFVMIAFLVVAQMAMPLTEAANPFAIDPWVTAMTVDLFFGFLLMSTIIFIVEPVKWKALLWCVPLFVVGNAVSAIWFLLNIDQIRQKLDA